jgi:hypothetical protein
MKRIFNTTGTCIPARHFAADISGKVKQVMEMIARGDYFAINRPRQYGKTTLIYHLFQAMQADKDYLPLDISFEGIGSAAYASADRFIPAVLDLLSMRLEYMDEKEAAALLEKNSNIKDFGKLSRFFTEFTRKANRKVVLMIDEVDKSSNNQLFLDFLGMLRTKYLGRNEGKDHSFHSVILAGVHDIKTLKTKIRRQAEQKYNSPWNIAVNFKVDLALSPNEISPMLEQYAGERNVKIDIPFFTEYLFYFTSGYPFLVSFLCKIIDEEILPGKKKKEWKPEDLVKAVQIALMEDCTNFESLIKNLENNPELYEFVFNIIMNEREYSYNRDNPVIQDGTLFGILEEKEGKAKIHNRLYEQRIYNYLASKMETSREIKFDHVSSSYIDKDGTFDIEKSIRKFQEFMNRQYSTKDTPFLERNGRLLFLAFIKPIINGRGFDFKEVEVSEEKRLDIVITFENQKYIVELKIWRGESYHQEGIRQLCDYLDRQNQKQGYLLIYDLRKEMGKQGQWEKIEKQGKEIFAAWV